MSDNKAQDQNISGGVGVSMKNTVKLCNKNMRAEFDMDRGGITSLSSPFDGHKADFVLSPEEFPEYDVSDCQWTGNISGKFSAAGGEYAFSSGSLRQGAEFLPERNRIQIRYPEIKDESGSPLLLLESDFSAKEELLKWTVRLSNVSDSEIIFSDINIPLLMNQFFRFDDDFKYDRCVLRHTCIIRHSSYLYWEKSSGNGPVLLLAPLADGEFIDLKPETNDTLFGPKNGEGYGYEGLVRVYSASDSSSISPDIHRFISLRGGETKELQFALAFLESEAQINDRLDSLSLTTLKAIPGMVGPYTDEFLVMTRPVHAAVSVCAAEDKIIESGIKNGWRVSRIRFGGCGRRYIQVNNDGNTSVFCFFGTEPVGDMIDGHAKFIAGNHLETDEKDPCYHGLLMWDMVHKRRINGTFNPYFEDWWSGGSDDPGLASGLFLSEKNVYRPETEEINVLNAFVEDFILKRLTEQPGWRVHRMVPWYTMFEPWAGRGADDVWRAFNYVHVINIMNNMYRIQKNYHFCQLRDGAEYLKMAYEYTKAMFHYWMFPCGVGASEYGNMGEMTLPLYLEDHLREEGLFLEAAEMGALFDKKADYFNSRKYPFGSEMVYDSTAFEAVYGYGKRIGSGHIMKLAARASYANRGKQPVWFLYNTDLRACGDTGWNSSYMTQLGAYPILDYALDEGHYCEDWIVSYFGSFLSGWLLYNSNGCWDADGANRGETGWITIASLINHTGQPPEPGKEKGEKLRMPLSKGCVVLSGEAGIGFFGALRTACSIVMDHSVLGRIGLGCKITDTESGEVIVPGDGLSVRFYHVPGRWKLEAEGGYMQSIQISEKKLEVHAAPLSGNGMTLRMLSIPEKGGKPKLIADRKLTREDDVFIWKFNE